MKFFNAWISRSTIFPGWTITAIFVFVINDLKTPYILKEGSFIKIPNSKIIRYEDQDIKLDIKESKNPEAAEVQPTVYSESLMEESQNGHQFSRGISSKITPEIESDNVQNIDESDKKTSDQFADNKMLDKIHQEEEERNKATSTEGNPVADNKKFYCKTPLDLPEFVWPLRGTIATRYGKNGNHFSEGINILAPLGTHIVAAGAGEVIYVGNQVKGYGNLIIIRHENDFLTAYAHTKDVFVKKGDKVSRGQKIATVGKTGNVDKEQLQFSVRHGKKTVNPDAPY